MAMEATAAPSGRRARVLIAAALGAALLDACVWVVGFVEVGKSDLAVNVALGAFTALAATQLTCALVGAVMGVRERRATRGARGLGVAIGGAVLALAAVVGWGVGALGLRLFRDLERGPSLFTRASEGGAPAADPTDFRA